MQTAMGFLRQIGPAAKAAIPELGEVLKNDKPINRAIAARALWSIGRDPRLVSVLTRFLGYEDKDGRVSYDAQVTCEAIKGLGEVGHAAKEVVPQLKKKLGDEDRSVREAAVEAIRKIDPEEGRKLRLNDVAR